MRDFFKNNGVGLVAVNDYIIEIATDKYKTYEICRETGISSPDTIRLSELRDSGELPFDLPAIIKKATGYGAKGMRRIESQEQLMDVINNKDYDNGWIVQKEIGSSDEEFTMGVFSDGKSVSSLAFKRKLGFGSMSIWVETVFDSMLNEIAERIAKKTNLYGSINVQMRKEDGKYSVFEINPRISSSCRFRHLNGFKDVVWWIQLCDNQNPDTSFSAIPGKVGIKILDEFMMN